MTAIAAVAAPDGSVYIGGDAAATDTWDLSLGTHRESKVWAAGSIVFGACGSFRVAQLLRWHLKVPHADPDIDPMTYVTGPLIEAMRGCLLDGGALTIWDDTSTEELTNSGLLFGYAGRVFEVFEDFGVGELVNGYGSVGCGSLIALGSLASTEGLKVKPRKRVRLALEAAERHSAGVRGPMTILRLRGDAS